MKRVIGIILALCLFIGMATIASAETDKIKIGYDIYFLGNSWSVQLAEEFKYAVQKYGDEIEVVYVDSQGDADKQVANLEDLIAQNVDVIITTPWSSVAPIPVIRDARAEGIKVVLLASMIDSDDYDCLVTVDEVEFGRAGAQWLADQLGGKGDIICLNGISGLSTSEQRWQGAQEVFAKYPDIKILASPDAKWDYAEGKIVTADLLAAYPKVDGIWSQGGAMTLGAIEAFQAANRPLVPMTGEDNNGYLKVWQSLQSEGMKGIACAKPTWLAEIALDRAIALAKGEEVNKDDIYPTAVFSDDELAKYVRTDLPDDFWANTHLPDEIITQIFSK